MSVLVALPSPPVALALNSKVVALVIDDTVVLAGIFVPVTPMPATSFAVEVIVTVASVFVKTQVASVKPASNGE